MQWHDGKPFTADDVVFNWQYAADPATAATTIGSYKDVKVEKVDDHTVRVLFDKPTPFWADAFVGVRGMIIPKHLFADYKGAKSRDAPTNLKPVGTGPYKFVDFKPGDMVRGEINTELPHAEPAVFRHHRDEGRRRCRLGGARRAADRRIRLCLEPAGRGRDPAAARKGRQGRTGISPGGNIEHIQLNSTDPWTEVDGERASMKTKHPLFSDKAVRQALSLLVDRKSVEDHIYGRTGTATGNFVNNPKQFVSTNTKWEFNIDKANQILEEAGWQKGPDGIRAKDGKKLKFVYQTSINTPRQKTQAIVKQACQKAGIDVELKSVTASVFFSSDVANPDTYPHFYCDMQMYTTTMTQPDPETFLLQFVSWEVAAKENKWQGRNITRWANAEADAAYKAAQGELDPVKRAAHFIKINDLACGDNAVIPVVARPTVQAINSKLQARISGWDSNLWNIEEWYKDA